MAPRSTTVTTPADTPNGPSVETTQAASTAPVVDIPIGDIAIAPGPGVVKYRSQGGIELTVKTN